jgi:tetratricopeptide (TPR) repeat protein
VPPWLDRIFRDSDGRLDWGRVGTVIVTVAGTLWAVFTFYIGNKEPHEKPVIVVITDPHAAQELTTQLIGTHQVPAGVGERAVVSQAVTSIIQGANEGDKRLEQAYGLLKENKITDAIEALKEVARTKATVAQQAPPQQKEHKEVAAAAAYRNLGAIAGLADPKRALEAYAKAIEFDPDDRESLYWHGWISLTAGHLADAEQSLERLLKLATVTGDQRGIYRANLRLGELAMQRGDLATALTNEEKAKSIAIDQTAAKPDDLEWQRDLSVSYEKIGNVQMAQSDLAAALKSYSDDLAITERLAQSDPGNALWQHDLSACYDNVGRVQKAQGDLSGALRSYSDSLAISEWLSKSDLGNAQWQRDVSFIFGRIATVQKQSGDKAKARDDLRQGQAIMAQLTKLSPDNAVWQGDLAWFNEQNRGARPRDRRGPAIATPIQTQVRSAESPLIRPHCAEKLVHRLAAKKPI